MADVHVLPGIERRDIVGAPVDSVDVLKGAIEKGITDVVIIGRHRDGRPYIAAATNDADRIAGMLMRSAVRLSQYPCQGGMTDEPPEGSAS